MTKEDYNDKLKAIQWITSHADFDEHQHIQLGNAIVAFKDCIDEVEQLRDEVESEKRDLTTAYMALQEKCESLEAALEVVVEVYAKKREKIAVDALQEIKSGQHLDTCDFSLCADYECGCHVLAAHKALKQLGYSEEERGE